MSEQFLNAGCLQLLEMLEILEISCNLKFLLKILEISGNFVDAPEKLITSSVSFLHSGSQAPNNYQLKLKTWQVLG